MNDPDEGTQSSYESDSSQSLERAMADAAHDAIFVVDERAHILAANHQAFAMFGYSLSELLGLGIIQLIAPSDRARITRRLTHNLLRTGSHFEWEATECVAIHKNGDAVPVEIFLTQIRRTRSPGFVSAFRDLRERKKAEEGISSRFGKPCARRRN